MNKNLVISKEKIAIFCKCHLIRRLSVFGLALRDDFAPDSDVDTLVEFEDEHTPGFAFFDMQGELSQLLSRKVDLHTPNLLSCYFRDKVLETPEVQYEMSS